MTRTRTIRSVVAALAACVALTAADRLSASDTVGAVSPAPPDEDAFVYKAIPDARVFRHGADPIALSTIWQDRPILLAMVFSRCAGTCSPLLRSLASAVKEAGGAGREYRIVIVSFDPSDTIADVEAMRADAGIPAGDAWVFGIVSPEEIRRLVEATGFWFRLDRQTGQYDHPSMVVAVDRGRVLRLLVGATVSGTQVSEIVHEFGGTFVPSYPLPGRTAFRCFEYDPRTGRYALDWGLLLLVLPGACAAAATVSVFRCTNRPGRNRTGRNPGGLSTPGRVLQP
jgi:protein SCO1/2